MSPRLSFVCEVQVLHLLEVSAPDLGPMQAGLEVVVRVQGAVLLGEDEDLVAAGKLRVDDVHVIHLFLA